jgi:hypothetical protein
LQVFLPELALYSQSLETELRLYRLTGGKVVTRAKDLPKGAVDIIITALEDQARYLLFTFKPMAQVLIRQKWSRIWQPKIDVNLVKTGFQRSFIFLCILQILCFCLNVETI